MTKSQGIFIAFGILFFLFIGCAMYFNGNYNFNDKADVDYFMNQAALKLVTER